MAKSKQVFSCGHPWIPENTFQKFNCKTCTYAKIAKNNLANANVHKSRCAIVNGRRYSHEITKHGTYTGYIYYGCQCKKCTQAASNYRKRYKK